MADGFLSRWSRRKLDLKEGRPLAPEPVLQPPATEPVPVATPASPHESGAGHVVQREPEPAEVPGAAAEASPPTLEDVARLTPESDFTRFVSRDVTPDVKNAALRKLFSDPHFNVMDRMDVYIDDYNRPDPIPESMLRKLAAGQFLKLFDEPEDEAREPVSPAGAVDHGFAGETPGESVAQCAPERKAVAAPAPDDHPDLRLQQDDAPPGEDPGPGHR